MKAQSSYEFDKRASGNFKVFYGGPEFLRENTRVNSLVFHHITPNPVRDEATLSFSMPFAGPVTIELMDITGRKTDVLFDGMLEEGYHEVVYRNSEYMNAGGVYIARVKAGAASAQQRMVIK